MSHAVFSDLGRMDYQAAWDLQQAIQTGLIERRLAEHLLFVEHPPTITIGRRGTADEVVAPRKVLEARGITVTETDRGGQVTYHGPGQIVAYPMVDLRRLGLGVRELVCRIEQSVIDVLAGYGIHGERREGAPGIYVNGAKVMALGLRVRRGCSFHGLAFNIAMDLEPFQRINPCGYRGLEVTSVLDLGGPADPSVVKPVLVAALSRQLGLQARFSPEPPDLSS